MPRREHLIVVFSPRRVRCETTDFCCCCCFVSSPQSDLLAARLANDCQLGWSFQSVFDDVCFLKMPSLPQSLSVGNSLKLGFSIRFSEQSFAKIYLLQAMKLYTDIPSHQLLLTDAQENYAIC